MGDCIFCKIVEGTIPANKVYEDEDVVAFLDINPVAETHVLLIPRLHIVSLAEVEKEHQNLLGKMLLLVPQIAKEQGCTDGFRTIINTGYIGGQEVFHLHIHIIASQQRLPAMIHHG